MCVPYGLDEGEPTGGALPALKPEDAQYFGKLLTDVQVSGFVGGGLVCARA